MSIITAREVRPGDWIRPTGSEWPREVARVSACQPWEQEDGSVRMIRRRFYLGSDPAAPVVEHHADDLVVTY